MALFYNFANLCNVWLRRHIDTHACCCLHSILICHFDRNRWRKPGLLQIHSWKKKQYFNYFARQLWIFFDTSLKFNKWKDSCSVESEPTSVSFLYFVTLKSFGKSYHLNWSLTQAWVSKIMLRSFGKYCLINYPDLLNIDTVHYQKVNLFK